MIGGDTLISNGILLQLSSLIHFEQEMKGRKDGGNPFEMCCNSIEKESLLTSSGTNTKLLDVNILFLTVNNAAVPRLLPEVGNLT